MPHRRPLARPVSSLAPKNRLLQSIQRAIEVPPVPVNPGDPTPPQLSNPAAPPLTDSEVWDLRAVDLPETRDLLWRLPPGGELPTLTDL